MDLFRLCPLVLACCGAEFSGETRPEAGGAGEGGSATMTAGGSGGAPMQTSSAGGGGSGGSGVAGQGGAGGDCVEQAGLQASVAACINVAQTAPSPAMCASIFANELFIDQQYSVDLDPYHAFLRFELGTDRDQVESLLLLGTVTDLGPSDASGAIWRVEPFSLADLSSGDRANVGTQPLAGDLGPVSANMQVQWELPPAAIADDGNLYLAIRPNSGDGVRYWNNDGAAPMRLAVRCVVP